MKSNQRTHLKTCIIKFARITIIFLLFLIVTGCNKSTVEAPDKPNNIWGFGNTTPSKINNTYHDKNGTVAKQESYTYYSSEEFQSFLLEKLNGNVTSIYEKNYQTLALEQLQKIKTDKVFSVENPLFILNPFGTNTSGLYIYMGTNDKKLILNYIVSVEDETISDFSEGMYINRSKEGVEGQIIGLLQGRRNKVVVEVNDINGDSISKKVYYFDVPDLDTIKEMTLKHEFANEINFTRGLFTFLAIDESNPHFLFYDNFGTVRSEIPIELNHSKSKILQVNNQIFYAARDDLFVLVNNIGHVTNYYQWMNDSTYYDYDCDEENNKILFIVGDNEGSSDKVISLSLETGEWKDNVLFTKLMDEQLKFNSIQVIEGNDIIVSSKELSSIIRINNVYSYPVIRWIMADESIWQGTNYEQLLLFKVGNFTSHAGQETIFYSEGRRLKEGQFYLSLLNFNYGESKLRPDLDWSILEGVGTKDQPATNSYYYRYLVDENQNRYELIQSLEIPYNTSSCMALPYGSNVVISIGADKEFREYNSKGEIMSKYFISDTNSSYQVFKYTMDRFWF